MDQYQKRLTWKYAQNAQRKISHGDEALTIAVSIQGSTLWFVTYVERPSGTSLGNSQIEHEFLRKWATLKHGVYHMCFHIFHQDSHFGVYPLQTDSHVGPKKGHPKRLHPRSRGNTHGSFIPCFVSLGEFCVQGCSQHPKTYIWDQNLQR